MSSVCPVLQVPVADKKEASEKFAEAGPASMTRVRNVDNAKDTSDGQRQSVSHLLDANIHQVFINAADTYMAMM